MLGEQPKLPGPTVAPRSTTLENWAPATVGERRPSKRSPTNLTELDELLLDLHGSVTLK